MDTQEPTLSRLARLARDVGQLAFIDLAPPIYSNMPGWWSHPQIVVIRDARNYRQHGYFCQELLIPEHVGAHVDAPAHIHPDLMTRTIDTYPVNRLVTLGKKVDASATGLQPGEVLDLRTWRTLASAQGVEVQKGEIVLVEFGWDRYAVAVTKSDDRQWNWWGGNAPGFSEDLCQWLASVGVTAVGTDTVACDAAVRDGVIVSQFGHETYFLPNDILILEGLYGLNRLPGEFLFMALPLNIRGGSGSPLRPIALVGKT